MRPQQNFFSLGRPFAAFPLIFALLLTLSGCSTVETVIRGETMGTTYTIKVVSGRFSKTDHLDQLIKAELDSVNESMSTYIAESEISRFNSTAADTPFEASEGLLEVMQLSKKLHKISGGAWDGSLDPLVRLWGFGRDGRPGVVPTPEQIRERLELVNFNKISISSDGKLSKADSQLTIDLASVAKGYGVDMVAKLLKEDGFDNFLVEVGGEIYASGSRIDGTPWKVGVNVPNRFAPSGEVYKVMGLEKGGFATSGDYRNYFESEGRIYSHIIDPRTGYPVTNGVVSASVLANSCALADGLATALMVMGPEGLKVIESLAEVEALIVVRTKEGILIDYFSTGFQEFVL